MATQKKFFFFVSPEFNVFPLNCSVLYDSKGSRLIQTLFGTDNFRKANNLMKTYSIT